MSVMRLTMQALSLLPNLLAQIAATQALYHRAPHAVSLLAVSKHQSVDKMRAVYEQGQRLFGENYLQEALSKMMQLRDCAIEWHFIGPIQRNKTRKIAEHFAWVQSVDKGYIAKRLHEQRPESLPPLNICIEVNMNNETSKSGVSPDELFPLLDECLTYSMLSLRGLMAIPAPQTTFDQQCETFRAVHALWVSAREYLGDRAPQFDTLSMGMSLDFEAAIKEGATMVRVGTGLFGARV